MCGGEGGCEKNEGGGAVERVHVRRVEGTNLHVSTQSSSFVFVHGIRAEPPNTPCKKPIKRSSYSTSLQDRLPPLPSSPSHSHEVRYMCLAAMIQVKKKGNGSQPIVMSHYTPLHLLEVRDHSVRMVMAGHTQV